MKASKALAFSREYNKFGNSSFPELFRGNDRGPEVDKRGSIIPGPLAQRWISVGPVFFRSTLAWAGRSSIAGRVVD